MNSDLPNPKNIEPTINLITPAANIGKPNFATSIAINGAAIAAMRTPPRLFLIASIGFSPPTKISNNVPNARELLTPPNIFLNGS